MSGKLIPDTQQLQDFLVSHYSGDISSLTPLDGGEWSKAFAFNHGDKPLIIRFNHTSEDFVKDKNAVKFSSNKLPIPRVTEIGEAFGGYFAVSERVEGTMLDELDETAMRRIMPSVLGLLDALRQIDTSASHGYGRWNAEETAPNSSWQEYLLTAADDNDPNRQKIIGWKKALANSKVGQNAFDTAYERMKELVPLCPSVRNIIHGDLLYKNVIVNNDRIAAVIDWGNSTYGDFLYDIAWFSYWTPWFKSMEGIDWEHEVSRHFETIGLEVPDFNERLLCYKLHIGLDGIAYNAFRQKWDELDVSAKRLTELAGSNSDAHG